jgi:hypothetical protein
MEKYNQYSYGRYWPVFDRYWPVLAGIDRYLTGIDRRWPVLTGIWPGTGLRLFYTGLGAGTGHSGHSGRYRNGIHNYGHSPSSRIPVVDRLTGYPRAYRAPGRSGWWTISLNHASSCWPVQAGYPGLTVSAPEEVKVEVEWNERPKAADLYMPGTRIS